MTFKCLCYNDSNAGKLSPGKKGRSSIDQPPPNSSSLTLSQRGLISARAESPSRSSRVVTLRGFTSASTSGLNYPLSYLSNAIQRLSVDHRLHSPALLRALAPSLPSHSRALSPTHQHQHAVSPSTVLTSYANACTDRTLTLPFCILMYSKTKIK